MTMKIKTLFLLVMIMGIVSFLFGCSKKPNPAAEEPKVIVPVELPEGVKLTGFYMNHSGMRMNPYYILKTTDSGTYMKITNKRPADYWMYGGEKTDGLIQPVEYFGYVETVREDEKASLICLEDETVIRQLEECIAKYGALGWDGYDKSKAMPDVKDSGDNYNLYLELSDGTTVRMHGYNICPSGFQELYQETVRIFQACSDYSRYVAKNFTDSPCEYLQVELKDSEHPYVCSKLCLRKHGGEWSVLLEDEAGNVLEKGTKIADYVATGQEVPFERFLDLMSRYQVEEWNGYIKPGSSMGQHFNIFMRFEDRTEFEARGSEFPEGYEAFKNAFVKEIYDFYMEEKFGVEKPVVTFAEKIRGSYMYYPKRDETKLDQSAVEEKEEDGFNEEYLIEFRYINQTLVAEVNYQRDFNSVYSRHMVELNPVSEQALESTTETTVQLTGREFSGFSMSGEYWDDAVSLDLQVVDEGLAYRLTGSDTVYVLERVENAPAMHEEETLKEYLGQIVDVPLVAAEQLDEIGILGEWHAETVTNGKQESSYLSFDEDGLMWFMRKTEGEPMELYRGAYGVANENHYPSIYVAAERSGYPYAPVIGIWNRVLPLNDSGTNQVLKLSDSDETMLLQICRTEEGMLEFYRDRKVLAGNRTNWQSAEPGTVLVDYYEATQATVGVGQHVEYVLRKTEAEDAVALEVYRGMEDEEETCMRYIVPAEAVEQSFEIIDGKELHNWNEKYDGGGLEGGIIVCRFFDGKEQIRISTDCMPEDGAEVLESIGHVIASYQQEKYRV